MGSLIGGTPTPAVVAPPPLPTRDDAAVSAAANKAKLDAARRRGRRSTVLTSGRGVSGSANIGRPEAGGKEKLG